MTGHHQLKSLIKDYGNGTIIIIANSILYWYNNRLDRREADQFSSTLGRIFSTTQNPSHSALGGKLCAGMISSSTLRSQCFSMCWTSVMALPPRPSLFSERRRSPTCRAPQRSAIPASFTREMTRGPPGAPDSCRVMPRVAPLGFSSSTNS